MSLSESLVGQQTALRSRALLSDPARLACAVVMTSAIATLPTLSGTVALGIVGTVLAAALVSRPNPRRLGRRLALCVPVIATLSAPFFIEGQMQSGMELSFRALSCALVVLTFTAPMNALDFSRSLATLRVSRSIVEVIDGLLFEVGALVHVAERIVLAQRLRGARGLRLVGRLLPELLVQSAERAQRVDLARRLRGYNIAEHREELTWRDATWAVLCLLAAGGLHLLALT